MTEKSNKRHKLNRRHKQNNRRKQAAREAAIAQAVTRLNNEQINARLRALLLKNYPNIPAPALSDGISVQQVLLVMTSAVVSLARHGLRLDMMKDPEEYTAEEAALQRRLDRNGRLLMRLVVSGLMRRGEVTLVPPGARLPHTPLPPHPAGWVVIMSPRNISQTLTGANTSASE